MKTWKAAAVSTLIALLIVLALGTGVYVITKQWGNESIEDISPRRNTSRDEGADSADAEAEAFAHRLASGILAPVRPALQASRKPVLHLAQQPMTHDDALASKLGGRAYWTAERPYPTGATGQPLFLLAQVDLSAMRLPDYPDHGLLQFFIANDDFYGANLDAPMGRQWMRALSKQRNFRVVYWPRPDAALAIAPPARVLAADDSLPLDPAKPQRLIATRDDEAIGRNDVHVEQVLGIAPGLLVDRYANAHGLPRDRLDDALGDELQRFGSKLGGYPDFTQQDPRTPADRSVLLLQIDSVDGVMWGDSGVANFFIDPGDLARADFSRVAYHWDCY